MSSHWDTELSDDLLRGRYFACSGEVLHIIEAVVAGPAVLGLEVVDDAAQAVEVDIVRVVLLGGELAWELIIQSHKYVVVVLVLFYYSDELVHILFWRVFLCDLYPS